MKTIDELLSRFHLIDDPKKNKIRVGEVLKNVLGIDIPTSSISIEGLRVVIKLEPVFKSYLYTKKEAVVKKIEEKLLKNNINILFK